MGDGRRDGRFYVDGRDETNAPEFAALGRRRLVGVAVAVVALFAVGLLWTRQPAMAAVVLLAFVFQVGVLVFYVTERRTIDAIRRRHLAQE